MKRPVPFGTGFRQSLLLQLPIDASALYTKGASRFEGILLRIKLWRTK